MLFYNVIYDAISQIQCIASMFQLHTAGIWSIHADQFDIKIICLRNEFQFSEVRGGMDRSGSLAKFT